MAPRKARKLTDTADTNLSEVVRKAVGEPIVSEAKQSQSVETGDLELVKKVLRDIAQDANAQASARAQAARTLAEMIGAIGRNAKPQSDDRKPLSEMTREELEAELSAEVR